MASSRTFFVVDVGDEVGEEYFGDDNDVDNGDDNENVIDDVIFWSHNLFATLAWSRLNRITITKGRPQLKKNVFFRALPESPKPPPHDPNLGNLVLFFSEVKIQDLKASLELKILYMIYIYCIYAT